MTDKDLIAKFLAEKGATQVPMGSRSLTEAQIKRKIGYEPEKTYRYEVLLRGEDGQEWMEIISAANVPAAMEKARENWPESSIISCEFAGARDERIYRSVW